MKQFKNLDPLPKAPMKGWSSEERNRWMLDGINAEIWKESPKFGGFRFEELCAPFPSMQSEKMEYFLVPILWLCGGCSGGWVRDWIRNYTDLSGEGGMLFTRLLEAAEKCDVRLAK